MQNSSLSPQDRLIVALDVPHVASAQALVAQLGDSVSFYKVGLELAFVGGLDLARALKAQGKSVFLDMKLHDIPNTVEHASANIARMGFDLLTVHAYPQTMSSAVIGRADAALRLLAVTVLTSMGAEDAKEAGYSLDIAELVACRVAQARKSGMDGIVCSPSEASSARALLGEKAFIVTPGIRPAGSALGDQKRVATPMGALRSGASHLVIGRPITQAQDPKAAALAILDEMSQA